MVVGPLLGCRGEPHADPGRRPAVSSLDPAFRRSWPSSFALDPGLRHGDRRARSRQRVAGPDRGGRLASLAFIARWGPRVRGTRRTCQRTTRSIATSSSGDSRRCGSTPRRSATMRLEPDRPGSTALGGGLFALLARDFAPLAERLASVAGRLKGIPAVPRCGASALVGIGRSPGRAVPDRDRHRPAGGHRRRGLIDDALAQAPAAAERSGGRGDRAAPGRGRRDGTGCRWRRSGRTCATSSCRRATARAGSAATCSPRRCATRCAPRR